MQFVADEQKRHSRVAATEAEAFESFVHVVRALRHAVCSVRPVKDHLPWAMPQRAMGPYMVMFSIVTERRP
jgi:hypothetical protein